MARRPTSAKDIGMCQRHRHESELPRLNRGATLIHPTGTHFRKEWPVECELAIAEMRGCFVELEFSPGRKESTE